MQAFPRHFFEFGPFRVEVEERRLTRDGQQVVLTAKAFDILLTLIQRSGRTVEKDELIRSVWSDTFVEEGNLNHHISTLRKVLGDSPREQRFIKTIPKLGYRFSANVREIEEMDETVSLDTVTRGRLMIREETIHGFWTPMRGAVAVCLFVVAAGVAIWGLSGSDRAVNAAARSEAVDAYRRGRELWQTRNPAVLHEATLLLEQAVQKDPQFALAHAALADAYAFDYANWKKAEREAREAMRLDASLGEPHASVGFVRMFWEWDLTSAQAELKQAVHLSPTYATGHQWYALSLSAKGQNDAAMLEIQQALVLDPGSVPINTDYCQILYFADRFDAARRQCEKVLEMEPESQNARKLLYQIALSSERFDEAVQRFVDLCERSPSDRIRAAAPGLRSAYHRRGLAEFRREQRAFYTTVDRSMYQLARVMAESGDLASALEKLRDAVAVRDFDMVFYATDPAFAAIRTSPKGFDISGRPL